jgi:hypothetical protein
MPNKEFNDFYRCWRQKAEEYEGQDIRSAFDRFITLYVIYNRLYAEVTFRLAQLSPLNLESRTSFPDAAAAKTYVSQYLGARKMMGLIDSCPDCVESVQAIITLLTGPVSERQFYIKLDKIDGSFQRNEDLELLSKFQSNSAADRAAAVLDFIYSVRCNLIHGHKGFTPAQIEVIKPATVILTRLIDILFERLSRP